MSMIAIGDIHGCAGTLTALLDKLRLKASDHLIFIGDYIDRGPDSHGVLKILKGLDGLFQCTFLRGNHEQLLLNYLDDGGDYDLWAMNGGLETLRSYHNAGHEEIPKEDIRFLKRTVSYHETDEFLFVHGGLKPGFTVAENLDRFDDDVFLWERSHLDASRFAWEKTVVCGHTPVDEPLNTEKLINIDTGCVYYRYPGRGLLTAVRLPEREFVMVPYTEEVVTP